MSKSTFTFHRSAPVGWLAGVTLILISFALAQHGSHGMSGQTMPGHTLPKPTPAQATPSPRAPLPLRASAATVVAVPPGIKETSVFLILTNTGERPLKITEVRSALAGRTMLMQTVKSGAMTGMKAASALVVPARGQLVLSAAGDHLMLMDLKRALKVGETLTLKLLTGDGRSLMVNATVRKP